MRKNYMILTILLAIMVVLGACSEDENNANNNGNSNDGLAGSNNTSEMDENNNDNSSEEENDDSNDNNSGSNGSFKVETEDQEDLVIGDTGRFDTTIGTYEVTLDSVEFLGNSLDDVKADYDHFILLNITVENTSDREILLDDIIVGLELTYDLELRGEQDAAYNYDSIEFFDGILESGDSQSGNLLMDIKEADEYYFREDPATVKVGLTNAVMWTFTEEDAD